MECKFCKNKFKSISSLHHHQKTARYCLVLQGHKQPKKYTCSECKKNFTTKQNLKIHQSSCRKTLINNVRNKNNIKIFRLKQQIEKLEKSLKEQKEFYEEKIENLQNKLENVAITAVKRPTHHTSNKTIQINNYIKNMEPLKIDHIKESVPMLTLDHHVKGPEGYAEYALEFPFKNRIVCVDVARNKIKYKNEEGDIIEDIGFRKMMEKLCEALKDRSFKLCQDHYEKLARKFSEEEMDNTDFDFMEAAKAIHKYANGRESDFCNKIIKLIGKGARV
jgi:DNA repair exonuclease SbcCD ATPase subunit